MKSTIAANQPANPDEKGSAIVTIWTGPGAPDVSIFAKQLYQMYQHYAQLQDWTFEVINYIPDHSLGIRKATFKVEGAGAYAHLKYETGVHRVQRVPPGERQDGIHTSTAYVTVSAAADQAALPLVGINPTEKIRTYNFPDDRVVDHRIRFALTGVHQVLQGHLAPLIDRLASDS